MDRRPEHKDKRLHPRYRVKLNAEVVVESLGVAIPYRFMTDNISEGGVFIAGEKSRYPFSKSSILAVWLNLPGETPLKIFFNAKIAHQKGDHGFGLKIVQINEDQKTKLKNFITDYVAVHPDALMDQKV